MGLRALLSPHCPQLEGGWQDLSSLADGGVLNLHNVTKSSSGLYRCQALDLDDMEQLEKDVELVVNCKMGEWDCGDLTVGALSLLPTLPWFPSLS